MKYVIFAVFIMIAMVMATEEESEEECIVWKEGNCEQNSDCCRALRCASDTKKCVEIGGIPLPGMDKRPLGPGPYPPNVKV